MTVVERILEKLEALPPDRRQEVLEFAEFLAARYARPRPRRSSRGLWSGLAVDLTGKDIDDVRRTMWSGFPREDVP